MVRDGSESCLTILRGGIGRLMGSISFAMVLIDVDDCGHRPNYVREAEIDIASKEMGVEGWEVVETF